jgi:hypothetical protein
MSAVDAMNWHSACYWQDRGAKVWDLGGWGEWKRKYGGNEITIPWVRCSKYAGVEWLRRQAKSAHSLHQKATSWKRVGSR